MRVLVLGQDGMLGSALRSLFERKGFEVSATTRRPNQRGLYLNIDKHGTTVEALEKVFKDFDFIINCLVARTLVPKEGIEDGIFINAIFPHLAAEACAGQDKIFIHVSTDGVFSGFAGPYYEDDQPDGVGIYSCSKILGEVIGPRVLNIRCSIIGEEDVTKRGLIAWFLAQQKQVTGFRNVIWNGVTTLQLAQFIHQLLESGQYASIMERTRILHFSPNAPISKYELLKKIAEVYEKNVDIVEVDNKVGISRILKTRFESYFAINDDFTKVLRELREFHLS